MHKTTGVKGLEPLRRGIKNRCLTLWLYSPSALRLGRIELPTNRLSDEHSAPELQGVQL